MSDHPKVSICIPSYNHAQFLPAAIESALGQTYPNIEIILADDGSSDDSLQIAKSYADRYPHLTRVFAHPGNINRGISETLNLAFEKSTGDYWSPLASDDTFLPEKTEQQVAFLKSHLSTGWVYSQVQCISEQGDLLPGLSGEDITVEPSPLEKLIRHNKIAGMTVLARRECYEQVGGFKEGLLYSDWEFWVQMATRCRVGFIKKPLVRYRVHSYNASLGIESIENFSRALEVMNSLRQSTADCSGVLTTPRIRALIELQRARYLFYLAQGEEAVKSLHAVFEIYPSIQDHPGLFQLWLTDVFLSQVNSAFFYSWLIANIPPGLKTSFVSRVTKLFKGLTFAKAAMESYQAGNFQNARKMAIRAQAADPALLRDRQLMSMLIRSLGGERMMNKAKQFKHRTGRVEES